MQHYLKIVIMLVIATAVYGQQGQPVIRVNNIDARSTNAADVSLDMLLTNIRMRSGTVFSQLQLSKDIKSLYDTQLYQDIRVELENQTSTSVDLVFFLTIRPQVKAVNFYGNQVFKTEKLLKKGFESLKLLPGAVYTDEKLTSDLKALNERYFKRGNKQTVISHQIKNFPAENKVSIDYFIYEVQRVVVTDVNFNEEAEAIAPKIDDVMLTQTHWSWIPFGYLSDTDFQVDLDTIRKEFSKYGYFDAYVKDYSKTYDRNIWKRNMMTIDFEVVPGEPYTVSEVEVIGITRIPEKYVYERLKIKVGDKYLEATEKQDLDGLTAHYQKRGYLDMRAWTVHEFDYEKKTVKVIYKVREGQISHIRDVKIVGNLQTQDKVIRRELAIQPGDLGNRNKIRTSESRLKGLNYFEEVNIIPIKTEDPALRDLKVQVKEQDTGRLVLSAAISDVDDVVGKIELGQSNFDIHRKNGSWIGGGQRARITTLIGSDLAELGVSYTEPWLFNKRLRMDIDLWTRQTSSNRDYDQKSIGGKILFTKKLPWQYWRHSVGYRIEEFDIDDIDESDYSQKFIDEEEGSELTSNLLYAITRDSRSSYTQPEYGSMVKLSSEFQSEAWGSYTNLYKLNLDAKKYYPIFKESIIKFSTRLGQVNGDDEKIFDRLFAGGTGTIRGFKPREVGPVDPKDENPVGGESLWVFTTEATTPLGDERIWGAVFIDGGNVWADPWDYDINEFNWSIGTGIRLKLPLGTFSLDYGYPIHEEQDHLDGGGRLHFNLGYRF
ncbi:MAG: outer membrane protein assembly factor BamA [Lentisphaeria bacterium]|nr:outer membrane protein assembly factor BamA [Lentisphaeria bacterium]